MNTLSFKTLSFNKKSIIRSWFIMDAKNQVLGRFSSNIANVIMGKYKIFYSPHIDCGDYVIVINSNNILVTGNKWNNKKYIRYTGYPGGKKIILFKDLLNKDSRILIYKSVRGMLPKSRLGRLMLKKLYVYPEENHKHQSQKPILLKN
ncbi:50S ribosomal protein L13 [Blattabacterium cuenoti]|uniref:50S ribosomal protein L13 n=1 Tax=Blattabacterium cuenoti TaxID=1653831 RepID=UPI00163B9E08|nr:50S ribosomal protein L13 [Blattabacterium cuenoti]